MRRKVRVFPVLFLCCLALILAGCRAGEKETDPAQPVEESRTSIRVPQVYPFALVDQKGYVPGEEKIVIFRTKQEEDTFEVRNLSDDAVVYTGSIRAKEGGTWYGQFGSFQTPGSYYIYTDSTGSSYAFPIDDAIGKDLQNGALLRLLQLRKEGEEDVKTQSLILCDLLLAYEINPDAYGDDGTRPDSGNDFPDLLDEAREGANILLGAEKTTQEEAVLSSCALAHAASVFSLFDPDFSAACLEKARRDWDQAAAYGTLSLRADAFAAASALYRMTGERTYEGILSAQFREEDYVERLQRDAHVFYGSVLYLLTKQPVNVAVRNTITEAVEQGAADIATRAENDPYFVSSRERDLLFDNMVRLSVANYFNYNHGYNSVLLNHLHYLAGRNPEAVNVLKGDTERTYLDSGDEGVPDHPEQLSKLLLLLGAS